MPLSPAQLAPTDSPPPPPPGQFYYLASVRMRDLCERLKLMDDVRETIWTVFEFVIVNHVSVMQGRHLDQLIMSAIFVVCKVRKCQLGGGGS